MNDTQNTTTTASYVDLTTETFSYMIEAAQDANKRTLEYAQNLWNIVTKPYGSTEIDNTVHESFDRANKIVSLTSATLQTSTHKTAQLAEKLIAQNAKLQDTTIAAAKGAVNTTMSNLNYVKDQAQTRFSDVSSRIDEARDRVAAGVSSN